jgi:hypothetical protein
MALYLFTFSVFLCTKTLTDHFLHFVLVDGKLPNTFREFVRGHLILVKHPPEVGLIHWDALHFRNIGRVQDLGHRIVGSLQLGQELGADGEEVAAGQGLDLTHVPEGRAHDNSLVTKLLKVMEHLGDADDSGIL